MTVEGAVLVSVVLLVGAVVVVAVVVAVTAGGGGLKTFVTLSLMKSCMSSMVTVQSSGNSFLASTWVFDDVGG